jgi:hypothetical protein
MKPPFRSLATLALILTLTAGCTSRHEYDFAPGVLERAAALPPEARERTAVPARLPTSGRAVHVRVSALPAEVLAAPLPGRRTVRVETPLLTAAVVLTCVGSVVSVVGSAIFFATWNAPAGTPSGDLHLGGGISALAAEPLMWAGTILWPLALMRPRHEVAPGRRDLTYLP